MSSKCKILVLGYFGFANNQLDGQTIKTRNIYKLLDHKQKEVEYKLSHFDTQTFRAKKLNVLKMFREVWKTDILFYIAAHNNLKYFFPIIYLIAKLRGIPIHYVVVGGWLAEFIENKPLHIKLLRNIEGIYPETIYLLNQLQDKYRFKNVYQLHNFRIVEDDNVEKSILKERYETVKLVFMARVHPMKGVDLLFNLSDEISKLNNLNITIDIYGPILEEYKNEFDGKEKNSLIIKYKGILQPNKIQETLASYDLMLFPTKYYTEGFPGSILDAYMAGIPVVATKWKYADEFIDNNVSGIISPFDNDEAFINNVVSIINNTNRINELKEGAQKQAIKYSPEVAWEVIKERVFFN